MAGMTGIARAALAATLLACSNVWATGEAPLKPEVVVRVDPIYPIIARSREIAGRVVVWVYIDAEGGVSRTRIRTSPHELLSDAVEAALSKWRFRAPLKDGKPVATSIELEFVFNLKDPGEPLEGALPPPDAATVARYVAALDGVEEYRTVYWKESGHKAFASADDGSWGWASRRSSAEQAIAGAQESCDRNRQPLTRTCRIVDVDGRWQESGERTATPFRMLSPFEMALHTEANIDAWNGEKKTRAKLLLEQCRAEAERFLPIWRSQEADAIYRAIAQELRDQYSMQDFEKVLGDLHKAYGAVSQARLEGQSLVTRWGDEDLRLDLHTIVEYDISTTSWKAGGLTFSLVMSREAGMCRVSAIRYLHKGSPTMQQKERGT